MAESDPKAIHRPRPRKARGQDRPQYLDSPDLDRVVMIMMGLMTEVSALRDRMDSSEALVAQNIMPTSEAIEAYRPDPAREMIRDKRRDEMLTRVLRVMFEERDAHDDDIATEK